MPNRRKQFIGWAGGSGGGGRTTRGGEGLREGRVEDTFGASQQDIGGSIV